MIQPIETTYKGYRMRSRLEARWAVFFDHLNVPWEYETEGVEIDGEKYLPDFWLPRQHIWFEVKRKIDPAIGDERFKTSGDEAVSDEAQAKARKLADNSYAVVVAYGQPFDLWMIMEATEAGESSGGSTQRVVRWDICGACHGLTLKYHEKYHFPDRWIGSSNFQIKAGCGCEPIGPEFCPTGGGPLREAANAARAARFEHGEQG